MPNKISKNIFWLSFSRLFAMLMLLVAYTKVYPYLGPFGAGQYQFIQSYVLIFAIIVDFGIQQFITKKISEEPQKTEEYFLNFLSFELVISFLLYLVAVTLAVLFHYDSVVIYGIMLAGLGMVASALTYPFLAVLSANQDLQKVAMVNFLNSAVNFSIMMLMVLLGKSIVFLSSVTLVFGILDLLIYWQLIKKRLVGVSLFGKIKLFDFGLIVNIFKSGWPFALLVGFSAVYNRVDALIIKILLGYEQTGLYTAAYRFFDLLGFFPSVVSFTLFPYFTSLIAKRALPELRAALEKYLRLMLLLALPLAFGGMALSAKLIMLITGNDPRFLPSAGALSILIWAPAVLFVYVPLNSLVISQLTKKAMVITGLNVIVNIAGNLLLIPYFGIKAAAAMTVVSESLQGVFYYRFVKNQITDFSFGKFFTLPFLAAAAMAAALWPVRGWPLYYTLPLGAAIYGTLLLIFGAVGKEDFGLLISLFKRQQS